MTQVPARQAQRWLVLGLAWLALATGAASAQASPPEELRPADWELYRKSYITADGRVVDNVNERVSHSEGQGYGMLLAVTWGDAPTFELLWKWTREHLQVRQNDKLMAWRWVPATPTSTDGKISDINNAADGDILIAWALYRASVRWERKEYFDQALLLARDIRRKLLRRNGRAVFLLPAETGFEKPDFTVLNLSYWVFPAIRDLGKLDPSPDWPDLYQTGLALLGKARFGDYGLPSDWLQVSAKTVRPAEQYEPLFSYNAVRIPLYLWWAGETTTRLYEPYADFLADSLAKGRIPASLNLDTDEAGKDDILIGMRRCLEVATALKSGRTVPAAEPLPSGESYYSASLLLLANAAAHTKPPPSTLSQLPTDIQLGPGLPPGNRPQPPSTPFTPPVTR